MDGGFTNATELQKQLNNLTPGAHHAKLGDVIVALITQVNAAIADQGNMRTAYAATLTKLDADAGVTDTNYHTVGAVAAATAATVGALGTR